MAHIADAVLAPQRIVVAIQDPHLRDRVSRALTRRGATTHLFEGMAGLWAAPLALLPSAAIVDCANPVAVIRQLSDFLPTLPILVLTGYTASARVLPLLALGNVRARQKPLDADEMLRALAQPTPLHAADPEQTLIRRRALG